MSKSAKVVLAQARQNKGAGKISPRRRQKTFAMSQPKRGGRGGPDLAAPGPVVGFGFIGNRPSRCNRLRASLRARRIASAFSRAFRSEGFS